jgi:ribosomal protein S18 acetylase RimI-like enzyme
MNFRPATREEIIPAYARLWAHEYPDDLRSEEEVGLTYEGLKPNSFEENWLCEDHRGQLGIVIIVDPEGKQEPERLSGDVSLDLHEELNLVPEVLRLFESACARTGARKFSIWTSDLRSERAALFETSGMKRIQRVPVTRLDLSTFDPDQHEEAIQRVKAQGISFTTVDAMERRGQEWKRELYDKVWEMVEDMPSPHAPVRSSFEDYCKHVQNPTLFRKDLMFLAVEGGEIVGYSRLSPSLAQEGVAYTAMSGVVRSHRRRGIVSALKIIGVRALKERGYRTVQTDNNEENPMYKLNLALGFRPVWHWLEYEKAV